MGMSAGAMSELVRRAYVDAAADVLATDNEKVTVLRICAMTGLYRKEVDRLQNMSSLSDVEFEDKFNRTTRVASGWLRDPDFQTAAGKPAVLDQTRFAELVKRYSGDMAPLAMRQELQRLGVLSINSRDQMKLLTSGFVNSKNEEVIHILGTDTSELIETISHNANSDKDDQRFQRKVTYVDIPHQYAKPFRVYAASESQKFLEKLDRWLAKRDNKPSGGKNSGSQISLGIYHFEKPNDNEITKTDGSKR